MRLIAFVVTTLALFGSSNALSGSPKSDAPPRCDIIMGAGGAAAPKAETCPDPFEIVDYPGDVTPKYVYSGDPIELYADCIPRIGGMNCEAWPQEYGSVGNLTYQWTVRVRFNTTTYPVGTNPMVSFSCQPLDSVSATVTVTNGSYSASQTLSYGCGNEIQ